MTKKTVNLRSVGGGSNTPLTDTYINTRTLEKSVVVDWLSVTFDFVRILKADTRLYQLDLESPLLKQLVSFFGDYSSMYDLPHCRALRGYTEGIQLGEFVKLFYGGEHTLNSSNKYSINLMMSGQACREFERYMNGNWHDLLDFLLIHNSTFKRIDFAIDDFDGIEYNIYDLLPVIHNGFYVSPLSNFEIISSGRKLSCSSDQSISSGFTITLGSSGSNQVCIYDKNLERKAKKMPTYDTDIWYRYEMRFVEEKAQVVAQLYVLSIEENDSPKFMKYASHLLYTYLDVKKPHVSDINVSRWKTDPKWKQFLKVIEKININTKHDIESTMLAKKLYHTRSYSTFISQMYMYLGKDDFNKHIEEMLKKGFGKFDDTHITRINNGRAALGKPLIVFEEIQEILDEFRKNESEE